jgi:Leu/Phe-tRNA-protein transferase
MEKYIEKTLSRFKNFFDVVKIQRSFKRAMSNPEYRMCRNRLLTEFNEECSMHESSVKTQTLV